MFWLITYASLAQNKKYAVSGAIGNSFGCFGVIGISNVTVTIVGNSLIYQTKTGTNGTFHFPEIANGTYDLIANYKNYKSFFVVIVFNNNVIKNYLMNQQPAMFTTQRLHSILQFPLSNFYPISTSTLSVKTKNDEFPSIKEIVSEQNAIYFDGVRIAGRNRDLVITEKY